jgi:hypothetical protein
VGRTFVTHSKIAEQPGKGPRDDAPFGVVVSRLIGRLFTSERPLHKEAPKGALACCDFQSADEAFSTGNYTKVSQIIRLDERILPGRIYRRARELLGFAHTTACGCL